MPMFEPQVDHQQVSDVPLCRLCSTPVCSGGKVRRLSINLEDDARIAQLAVDYAGMLRFSQIVFEHPELVVQVWDRRGAHLFWMCQKCLEGQLKTVCEALKLEWVPEWKDGTSSQTLSS